MASFNDIWLGFSLSPKQAHHPQNSLSELGFNSDHYEQVSNECFNLTSEPAITSFNTLPPPPFAIFEASARNPHSQDWNNMKDVSLNSFSCSTQQNQETPKLENFLGGGWGQSFSDNNQEQSNLQSNGCANSYRESEAISHTHFNAERMMNSGNSNIGLSMIKNWLRNHPVPPHVADSDEAPPPPGQVVGAQTLSLSMSTGSQSSEKKVQSAVDGQNSTGSGIESLPRKSSDTFGQRTSIYRGVTRHRWTGRYEAHLWDNSCRREGQNRKGRQVYLGGYDKEEKAARAYDLAALKYWGTTTTTNFPISNYEKELEEMNNMTRQEYVASLRRKSSGFSRGASIYRGVTRHHQHGRWQARIGRVAGNKDLYLGTFSTQEEAAEAYDIAAIKFRGQNAVTNFEINRYDVKRILESSSLPIGGGAAKRLKDAENAEMALQVNRPNEHRTNGYGNGISPVNLWPAIAFQAQCSSIYSFAPQRMWCKQEQDSGVFDEIGKNQGFLQPCVDMQNHGMISMASSPVEQSPGPNSFIYGANGSGFVDLNGNIDEEKAYGYDEGMFGSSTDAAYNRNLYDQSCHTWIPNVGPTFAAWNDL